MSKQKKEKKPRALRQLSHDLAKRKHHLFIDSARSVKDEFRENLVPIIESELKKRNNSILKQLKSLSPSVEFIADAVTEWCFSYSYKHYETGNSNCLQTVAVSIVDSVLSQDALDRKKLNKKELKKLLSRKSRHQLSCYLDCVVMKYSDKALLGVALINLALSVNVEFDTVKVFDAFTFKNAKRLCFHHNFIDYINDRDFVISNNYFTKTPVYESQNWTNFNNGGFIDKYVPLIKTDDPIKYAKQKIPKSILEAVNICQNVQFVVNEDMYEFINIQRGLNNKDLELYGDLPDDKLKKVRFSISKKLMKTRKNCINSMIKEMNIFITSGLLSEDYEVRFIARMFDIFMFFQGSFFFEKLYDSLEFITTLDNLCNGINSCKKREKRFLFDHWNRRNSYISELSEKIGKYYQQNLTDNILNAILRDGNQPFKYVFTLDYRGRFYANASGLNAQGDKMSKNLVKFAQKTKLGEKGFENLLWLIAGLADEKLDDGCKLSKASKQERINWSMSNYKMLVDIGKSPIDNIDYINVAGDALEFTQACQELYKIDKWIEEGNDHNDFESSFICRLDATCSGSQAMSIILKDLTLAESVNVAYSGDRVQDYYAKHVEIYENIENYLDQIPEKNLNVYNENDFFKKYIGKVNRKHMKRAVMTYCYSVSMLSGTDYIIEELSKTEGIDKKDYIWLSRLLWECVLIGGGATTKVMRWYQECIKSIYEQIGTYEFSWPCPDGMICYDIRMTENTKLINTVLGTRVYQIRASNKNKIDNMKNISAVSPNITHSIDKFVLGNTIRNLKNKGCNHFAPIHDSIGVPLAFAHEVVDSVNNSHLKLYEMNYLERLKSYWEETYGVKLPSIPTVEKMLKPEHIKNSNNCFC